MPRSLIEYISFTCDLSDLRKGVPENIVFGFTGKGDESAQQLLGRTHQVHGTAIVALPAGLRGRQSDIKADGVYTRTHNHTIAVVTADCLPVLLFDTEAQMVMAVHAGWRGLTAGILSEAVKKFEAEGIAANKLMAICGPCISPAVFEVGPEVKDAVLQGGINLNPQQAAVVLRRGSGDRWFLDMAVAACLSLANMGVSAANMSVLRRCTYTEADQWFSYRRTRSYEGNNFAWIRFS